MDKSITSHTLHTDWIIWYHNPTDKNWNKESYKSILELNTIEDFIAIDNSWSQCLPSVTEGMYFIMRKTKQGIIYPRWEDSMNKKGGYWSFKVDNETSHAVWSNLCKFLIGETICVSNTMLINGLSISPKKKFCIIKIWNKDASLDNMTLLSDELKEILNMDECKYSSHIKNIKRDKDKIDRYKSRRKTNNRMTRF